MKQAPRRGERCLPGERIGTPSGAASDFIATSSHEDATAGRQDQEPGTANAQMLGFTARSRGCVRLVGPTVLGGQLAARRAWRERGRR